MDKSVNRVQQLFFQGRELLQSGKFMDARTFFEAAINISAPNAMLYLFHGATLHEMKLYEEAINSYQNAISISPDIGEVYNNLGNSLMATGRFSEASDFFLKSSELLSTSPIPITARATALQALGKVSEAEKECRKAIMLAPDFAAAHWNLALNLLLQGQYAEGWIEYEWRWLKPDFTSPIRHTNVPLWDGSELYDRTILLHAEQGFGDAIQFIRYAPMVAKRSGRVIIECHPELVSLIKNVEGVSDVFPFGAKLPSFNIHAPLLSLPKIFKTDLLSIPAECPYLSAPVRYCDKWELLFAEYPADLKIGLVWVGKEYPDPRRSCKLVELAPLAEIENVTFFSIQIGKGTDEAASPPPGMSLVDLTAHIDDFSDTAAMIKQLDLVISIDTSVAHLASAVGKPLYLLLPFAADWRWLLDRSDSPWYPTVQLFRQQQPGNWSDVISDVASALKSVHSEKQKSLEGIPPKD